MSDSGLSGPERVGGLRRLLYIALGLFFVGLAVVGAILPVLPTTPFLLLAGWFFVRSSPALNAWLLRSRLFGPLMRDWQRHRAVRPRVKITAVLVLVATVSISLAIADPALPLMLVVLGLASIGLLVVLRLPVLREPAPEPPPLAPERSVS